MREIKFRYVYQHEETGRITTREMTLETIEKKRVFLHRYAIVARCQFTGLKDKNGKEVYEGDILCFTELTEPHRIPFLMAWNDKAARWVDYSPKDKAEVIGNIYENPELLK